MMNIAEYNVACLEQRRVELVQQIKKYPKQMAWIEIELARAKILAEELSGLLFIEDS
jgi:hypothetical protein